MPIDQKKDWQDWVSTMTHAYTTPVSDTTASDTDQSGPQHHAINQEA